MRRFLIIGGALVVLIGAGGYVLYRSVGREGSGQLENWVGRSVVGIIESHLTATAEFDRLDYQAPATVVLDGLKLTGAAGQPLVQVDRLQLTLARTPRLNEPVQIARVQLDSPCLHFRQDAEGELVGWSNLVDSAVAEKGLDAVPEPYRLSEVLVMREIDIRDGRIEYHSSGDEEPMVLHGVTLTLHTAPDEDDPGWYGLNGSMSRAPQLEIDFDGRANLDSMLLDLARLEVSMRLEQEQYESLPPQLQTLVRRYELRGQLEAAGGGTFPVSDLSGGNAWLEMTLSDAFASFGESVLPVKQVRLKAAMADRTVSLDAMADLLSGSASAKATANLYEIMSVNLTYSAAQINLRQTLATTSRDAPPKYDGILSAAGQVRTSALSPLESISGSGDLTVEQGRLVNLPIISDLTRAISSPFGGDSDSGSDAAQVDYDFKPDRLEISEFELVSPLIVARGDGRIYYDQRLSLAVNAGPMEKVQRGLGKIGAVLGGITDRLVKYYVSGTIEDPSISVKPLGIGAGR